MPSARRPKFTIAAVQATPVFLEREATVEKACSLITEAARVGARLIVFPEAFIPTYPDWVWALPPAEMGVHNQLYADLLANCVEVPGDATERLCAVARKAKAVVVIGINERNVESSGTSLYNSLLYIDADGDILGVHRKLVPTNAERLVWAPGDGSTLQAFDTPLGKVGGLICWENYMPLARYALYAWGTEVYLAPTWDRGQSWVATLQHIAKEGRCYVVGCCIAMRKDDISDRYDLRSRFYANAGEWINIGDSAIVAPGGEIVAGPVRMKEEILYAEVDPAKIDESRYLFDVAGHYSRPDVFELTVHQEPRPIVTTSRVRSNGAGSDAAASPAKKRATQTSD